MQVTVLGSGDSAGVPQIGCSCPTCTRYHREEKERTRFSLLVENGDDKVLVDTSPDLRTQLLREEVDDLDAVIFTHAHYDHYAGLGNLYRAVWHDLPIYSTDDVLENIVQERFGYLPFPEPRTVEPYQPFEVCGLEIEFLTVKHPPMETYGLAIRDGSEVIVTGDTARDIPEESLEKMRNPDLLVADAFIPHDTDLPDFVEERISPDRLDFADKHMTYKGAFDLVNHLNPQESVFVHLSHYYREQRRHLGWDGWSWHPDS